MQNVFVLTIVIILVLAVVLFIYVTSRRRLNELKEKTDFAVQSDDLIKIEMSGRDLIAAIAANFNQLGERLKKFRDKNIQLSNVESEKLDREGKLKVFETHLSQLNMLTDIGRDLTASLNVNDIAKKLFKYISSSMMAEEISLLALHDGVKHYYTVKDGKVSAIENLEWCTDPDNILNWSFENNKEVYLNDADKDYAQYVFKVLKMQDGSPVAAVIAVPLSLSNIKIGAVSVICKSKNAFSEYHLDFSRSIASYVSVAIYNANLYGELGDEKQKSEDLLLNILPGEVANELKKKGKSEARLYKNVSVMFTDFVNFTGLSSNLTPQELIAEIDFCFKNFDEISDRYGLEKIKTIGDSYFAVCGLPAENPSHAQNIIHAAKDIILFISNPQSYFEKYPSSVNRLSGFKDKKESMFKFIRVGVNSGPVVAGIVGSRKFAYDIWGDTVNVASRMESNSESNRLNISGTTYELVKDDFKCEYRGRINAKNKGEIDMYFVN
ncbi:MAG: GAF domain-containing protein [Flavobacteriales bacterium]|nr:GAF domain-containing protein [Flavobacteriales bacterium]